jgi:hypothetical protein
VYKSFRIANYEHAYVYVKCVCATIYHFHEQTITIIIDCIKGQILMVPQKRKYCFNPRVLNRNSKIYPNDVDFKFSGLDFDVIRLESFAHIHLSVRTTQFAYQYAKHQMP